MFLFMHKGGRPHFSDLLYLSSIFRPFERVLYEKNSLASSKYPLPFDVSIPAFSYHKAPFAIPVQSGTKHGQGNRYLNVRIPYSAWSPSSFQVSRLALCGDVHNNPGPDHKNMPSKFPCKEFGKAVRNKPGRHFVFGRL